MRTGQVIHQQLWHIHAVLARVVISGPVRRVGFSIANLWCGLGILFESLFLLHQCISLQLDRVLRLWFKQTADLILNLRRFDQTQFSIRCFKQTFVNEPRLRAKKQDLTDLGRTCDQGLVSAATYLSQSSLSEIHHERRL